MKSCDEKTTHTLPSDDFAKEQYSQYWQMKRFHLSLSWHIPTLAIVAVVAFLGFDPDRLARWDDAPFIPAVVFLAASLFVILMWIHHRRNLLFANIYEKAIADLEEIYGMQLHVHHKEVSPKLTGLDKLSSSMCLSVFLIVLAVALGVGSLYFWIRLILKY